METVVDGVFFSICDTSIHSGDIGGSKSNVVKNRAEIWTFLVLPNFRWPAFQKMYTHYHPCLAARRLEKFHEDTPTSPEVIGALMLNFCPNFKFSRLKFLGDSRLRWGVR